MLTDNIKILIKLSANAHGIDEDLLFAICKVESDFNQYATRYEDTYRFLYKINDFVNKDNTYKTEKTNQKTSFGIMQVLGAVLREYGYDSTNLRDILNLPADQLYYGCIHLKKKLDKYGYKLGILAYNSGSPIKGAGGEYINIHYYNKVMRTIEEMKGVLK